MAVFLTNPAGLEKPPADVYRHVAVATGTRHVYIAGQIARDAEGNPVAPGDLSGQVAQAYRNIGIALSSVGGSFNDVVRLTFYVVDWTPEKFPALIDGIASVTQELDLKPAPASLVEVVSLFAPDVLVEIEATAVLE